jgi:hypothetical protein
VKCGGVKRAATTQDLIEAEIKAYSTCPNRTIVLNLEKFRGKFEREVLLRKEKDEPFDIDQLFVSDEE